ncbi:hypothetical protein M378DRAFT_24180 [Amanita muscaria Koide BX008]|uniref:Uncharacterized protein n=1 Tax=Amanita muscaria (strain Koide BX008) TaxID=946122 RepID=A0A0C2X762_AMAMK|nr:hypothetical protein M378DRAFT_24180 [Amanita muscaria Koide BX008]
MDAVGWFRTMIQFDRNLPKAGWATLSLGSMDLTLYVVTFSPTGLSSEAGCVAAMPSFNMDLHLWEPIKNY